MSDPACHTSRQCWYMAIGVAILASVHSTVSLSSEWEIHGVIMRRIHTAIIWLVTLLLLPTSYFTGKAASATVYVDPAGTCGGKTPCYQWISQALSNVSDGGTVIVTR